MQEKQIRIDAPFIAAPAPNARHGRRAALAVLALAAGLLAGCATSTRDCARSGLAFVGTEGGELRAVHMDACAGILSATGSVTQAPKPRWAVAHPTLPMLYVASDGPKEGSVLSFAIDRDSGALRKTGEVSAGGSGTTHLWLDAPSMTLLAANFGSGTTSSVAVNADGSLGALVSTVKATGAGPHRRQASPHSHGISVDPSGRYALVSDLGADRVFVYGLNRATHALSPEAPTQPRAFVAPPGSGPRHTAFGRDGRFVYLLNELSADITTLRWDAQTGKLALVQSLPISSSGLQGNKSGSEVAVGSDGRFVYVANRAENELLVYRADAASGELSLVQSTSSGGALPWTFAIHPSGRWMLVANKQGNKVQLFRIDSETGRLTDTGQSVEAPDPVSVTFANQ